jgi:Transposase DDE domain
MLMAWGEQQHLVERFRAVSDFLQQTCQHWKLGASYGGWVKAQMRDAPQLVPGIVKKLRSHMRGLPHHQRCGRWEAFAIDGSKIACPRTRKNQQAMGEIGKPEGIPQSSLTAVLHLATGLPWDFRAGPGTDAERAHLRAMLPEFPAGSLAVTDAGFPGYGLCREMTERKQAFLLRVGGNLHLLTELEYEFEVHGQTVYLWPQEQQGKNQPPLQLRLIVVEDEEKQPVYLITNVLAPDELTDEEAGDIYQRRWGIEVFFRTTKQTMQHHTMLSRTPETCFLEMTWAFLGVWLLELMTAREIAAAGKHPCRRSPAQARNCVRRAMSDRRPCLRSRVGLCRALAHCLRDDYVRTRPKASRNYPRKKQHKPPDPPIIKPPNATQLRKAKQLTPISLQQK